MSVAVTRRSQLGRSESARVTAMKAGRRRAEITAPALHFLRRMSPEPTLVFDTYWKFAAERQATFHRRIAGEEPPWTRDPVLRANKFTNVYRASDRVSQFLIRQVVYGTGERSFRSTAFRTLLFKVFNKISTWELLEARLGEISDGTFDKKDFDRALSSALAAGTSIYSNAYIMPSGAAHMRRPRKHQMHLELLSSILRARTIDRLCSARSMKDAYEQLLALPSIGPFLAYQFVIDLNYGPHFKFSEMDFVVPGPGARDGLRKCFSSLGDYDEADTIRWVTERQHEEFARCGVKFQSLWGRPLQLIDCQNLFCEVDKYARVVHPEFVGISGRTRIKQRFSPQGPLPTPWFPPKWGLNDRIETVLTPRRVLRASK